MYRICLVTGSRAEYGIMKPLIERLVDDLEIRLDIIATAMHMEEKYGFTYQVIEEDGYSIFRKIPISLEDTSKKTVVHSISALQLALINLFEEVVYDLIIILGDRYEMLAVANVALIYNIPVCHLHGGEKTLGNFDEYIRHAITKMSHLHLAATDEYKNRILQMGEEPERVVNTGALGVENVLKIPKLSKDDLSNQLTISLPDSYYVILFHPVTLDEEQSALVQVKELLAALDQISVPCIFIGSNSDTGSDLIMSAIEDYVAIHKNCHLFKSLTTQQYHSLILYSKGLVGNSSSGLIEVPSLKRPTLNIGNRQKGRLHGGSVIDVSCEQTEIFKGLKRLDSIKDFSNPYEQEDSSLKAYCKIKEFLHDGTTTLKDFQDIRW